MKDYFGGLQSSWGFIENASHGWNLKTIEDILMARVIMHNMIIEDERDQKLVLILIRSNHKPRRHGPMRYRLNFEDHFRDMK